MPRVWSCTVLNNLVKSIETSDSKEISRLDLILRKINNFRISLFPPESCACLDKVNTEFFHKFCWLWSKERNFRISPYPSNKYLYSFQHIRKPMTNSITKSENMNPPGYDIIIVKLVHVFPYKFMMLPQPKSMNMEFRPSSKDVCLCAPLLQLFPCKNLNSNCVDSVMFFVCKINYYILKAIVWAPLKFYELLLWFVSDIANVSSSKFEKLGIFAFLTLQEVFLVLLILCQWEYCV